MHLHEMELPPEMFATSWFVTLFTDFGALPRPAVAEVWDQIFARDGAPSEQWAVVFGLLLWLLDQVRPPRPVAATGAALPPWRRGSRTPPTRSATTARLRRPALARARAVIAAARRLSGAPPCPSPPSSFARRRRRR